MTVGLTGQSGSGKSEASRIFAQEGFYVIDCDVLARKALMPNTECAETLSKKFPRLFDEGVLNRKRAAELLFSDRELLDRYNAAVFPFILRLITDEIKTAKAKGHELILLDAPTLFEAGADKLCDKTVCCIAKKELRMKRIMERDSISEELAEMRLHSQKSDEFFINSCGCVIRNDGSEDELRLCVKRAAERIKESGKWQKGNEKKAERQTT